MRTILPAAMIAALALAGCSAADEPAESQPPPSTESPAPTPTPADTAPPEPTGATADPQPSEIADAPYRIEDEAILGSYSIDDIPSGEPLVAWARADGTLVHVIGAGSSTTTCQPIGESIEVDNGMLDIEFDWEDSGASTACTADLRIFGWAFPITDGDTSITQAVIDEWASDDADEITVEVRPAMAPN